ncbi:nitrite/sulfite reductase [Synechococcus sp. BDU 130192]|uniref:nitrite/sulfite reductase n=1 Tax=Synechococcus sp. BDU 130192 TaxID=2042059 RepID=UPI000C07B3C6|nr:nitrite/sulfite reductase [Synechococcus sp. BDU 130192]
MTTTTTPKTWKEVLGDRIPPQMAEEIDTFENQMALRCQDKLDEKVFAELRLRRGAYGQRYDNGFRNDGVKAKAIPFPKTELTKGPDTKWQAPGMQRIKIPYGGMTAEQMDVLADICEEYSDNILHITTRQDIQLHFISLDNVPDMHRRLAAVGITVREACGNSVRNVTACPLAGVCHDEVFDVTGHAQELTDFFLGHRDIQDFGRKLKIAFSGCEDHPCGLTSMHDLGFIAKTKEIDGEIVKGFKVYVGGGLGSVPFLAKLFEDFVPLEEIFPLSQAIFRVFARLGEKKNRNKARIKFLVQKLGLEEFKRLVTEERATLEADPGWTAWVERLTAYEEKGKPAPVAADQTFDHGEEFTKWKTTNLYPQRQAGFYTVAVSLPLGDATSPQFRGLADIVRKYTNDTVRTTVEQNILIRWVHEADLPALYADLKAINLHSGGAHSIIDITACPGTDTCKLGIGSSRGLAGELRRRMALKGWQYDQAVKDIRVKISGCFNSCSQHMVAEIGFYGSSRQVQRRRVPHFNLVLGGEWANNASTYGKSMGVLPSKRIPDVVEFLIDTFMQERLENEKFTEFFNRIGRKEMKERLQPFTEVPSYEEDPSFYSDWADTREFTLGDIGVGECAGEVVTLTDFSMADAESLHFDATVLLDNPQNGDVQLAADKAIAAMVSAAQALLKFQNIDISDDPEVVSAEFRKYFYDTELFFDPFAKGKFAQFFFSALKHKDKAASLEQSQRLVEESRLFIEAAHACNGRMIEAGITSPVSFKQWLLKQGFGIN